jgi:quinoprotein glucose dehydrogenase
LPTQPGQYAVTSPPAIAGDLVITGSAIGDNRTVELELGTVRAFDARTGARRWAWDPIPREEDERVQLGWQPAQAARTGAANAWSILSVDPERDLVFVPTGAPSPDFYGGERLGDDAYANSVVALKASTGELVWSRQLVHHDLWDYDVPAQPVLVDLERDGRTIPAVIQATKMGLLFTFDRTSGEPLFALEERPVPQGGVAGEQLSPTQPFPLAPPPLVSQAPVMPADAWGLILWDKWRCRELIERYHSEGIYTPPSLQGTIMNPGYTSGVNWGSLAFDPKRQLAIVNAMQVPMVVTLVPRAQFAAMVGSGEFNVRVRAPAGHTLRHAPRGPAVAAWHPLHGPTLGHAFRGRHGRGHDPLAGAARHHQGQGAARSELGMPNLGGPIVTAGGLIFIAAATDGRLRAFDVDTGEELWHADLPAGGQATPMTYQLGPNGKQDVVIAAGGHGALGTTRGDRVIAFALPD